MDTEGAWAWQSQAPERALNALSTDVHRFEEACLAKLQDNRRQELAAHPDSDTAEMREWYDTRETFVRNICRDMDARIQEECRDMLDVAARVTLGSRRTPAQQQQEQVPGQQSPVEAVQEGLTWERKYEALKARLIGSAENRMAWGVLAKQELKEEIDGPGFRP